MYGQGTCRPRIWTSSTLARGWLTVAFGPRSNMSSVSHGEDNELVQKARVGSCHRLGQGTRQSLGRAPRASVSSPSCEDAPWWAQKGDTIKYLTAVWLFRHCM